MCQTRTLVSDRILSLNITNIYKKVFFFLYQIKTQILSCISKIKIERWTNLFKKLQFLEENDNFLCESENLNYFNRKGKL